MMSLYKRGQSQVLWYTIYVNGRRIRKSTGTDNKRLAQDIEAKTRTEIREGRFFQKDQGNKKTFTDMTDRYMQEYAVEKAPKSVLIDTVSLKHLLPVFGDEYLSQITPDHIVRYKTQRRRENAAASSINKELAFCKHAFNLAIREWEWVRDNPFSKVSMEKLPSLRVRYLTREEFERLHQVCNDRLKPIVLLAVNTGMRQDEILSLTWQNVDLSRGAITLEHTKNGERRGIPMIETVKKLLSEQNKVRHIKSDYVFTTSTGTKIDASKVRNWFRQACKKAGITDFRFHDLRHTCASWLAQNGVDLYVVQRILGHKTIAMTMRYAHLAPDNLRAGLNTLNTAETATKTATANSSDVYNND